MTIFSLILMIGAGCKNELQEEMEVNTSSDSIELRSSISDPEDALEEILVQM